MNNPEFPSKPCPSSDIPIIEENAKIVEKFKTWYEDIKKSTTPTYTHWYIESRFKIILEGKLDD